MSRVQQIPSLPRNAPPDALYRAIEELFIRHASAINANVPPVGFFIGKKNAQQVGLVVGQAISWPLYVDSVTSTDELSPRIRFDPLINAVHLLPGCSYSLFAQLSVTFSHATNGLLSVAFRDGNNIDYGLMTLQPESANTQTSTPTGLRADFFVGADQPELVLRLVALTVTSVASIDASGSEMIAQVEGLYTRAGLLVIAQ